MSVLAASRGMRGGGEQGGGSKVGVKYIALIFYRCTARLPPPRRPPASSRYHTNTTNQHIPLPL